MPLLRHGFMEGPAYSKAVRAGCDGRLPRGHWRAGLALGGGDGARWAVAFISVQAGLVAIWLVLHIRRLRDAGQGPAAAIGVALVYILSLGLLLMLVAFFTNPDAVGPINAEAVADSGMGMLGVFLLGILSQPDLGVFMTTLQCMIVVPVLL